MAYPCTRSGVSQSKSPSGRWVHRVLTVKRPAEVAERLAMNDTFIRSIMEDGEVLYE